MLQILFAAAAASATPQAPIPPQVVSEAAAVIDRQNRQPPRNGPTAGMSAEETDVVISRYLASIGRPLDINSSAGGGPGSPHP